MVAGSVRSLGSTQICNNMKKTLSRRLFITQLGAALGFLAGGSVFRQTSAHAYQAPTVWRGTALGAAAQIQLYHDDPTYAAQQIQACVAEVARLEALFSLYRDNSALNQLNRQGFLEAPAIEMIALMSKAISFSALTKGAFDVTVQPLWQVYADHFSTSDADPAGPSDRLISQALKLVGSEEIDLSMQQIRFGKKGMAVSLNGIAQGYITEHVCDKLESAGIENALVHFGETQVLGSHPDGRPWMAGIPVPAETKDLLATIPLKDQALATSGGYGSPLSRDGRHHHLLDPRTGRSVNHHQSVSVIAPGATDADMLSTAIAILHTDKAAGLLTKFADTRAIVLTKENKVVHL